MNFEIENKIKKLTIEDKSEDQLKMDLYATMIPFLLSDTFKRNNEIREFTDQLLLKKEMKEYLFASRTQIIARMVREIDSFNELYLKENIEIFKEYSLSVKEIKNTESKRQKKEQDKIHKMMNKYSRNKEIRNEKE